MRSYNAGKIDPSGSFFVIPRGKYELKITSALEGLTKNEDYKVTIDVAVVGGDQDNKTIRFHTVTFLPDDRPGAGMAIHFIHCIKQPCNCKKCQQEGKAVADMVINPRDWEGKHFMADVEIEKDFKQRDRNVIKPIGPAGGMEDVSLL